MRDRFSSVGAHSGAVTGWVGGAMIQRSPRRRRRLRSVVAVVTAFTFLAVQSSAEAAQPVRPAYANGGSSSVPAPTQGAGSAAGRSHAAGASQDTDTKGAAGRPPGQVKGAVSAYKPSAALLKKTESGATSGSARVRTGVLASKAADFEPDARSSSAAVGADFDAQRSSADAQVFDNADGTFTAHVYSNPVDYQVAPGHWAPIDPDLAAESNGRYREKAGPLAVSFAASGSSPDLMSLRAYPGQAVSFGMDGAAAVAPTVSGPEATYPGIEPGVDLQLTSTMSGIEQSLVLHSAADAGPWYFPMDAPGLTPRQAAGGAIDLVDAAGTTLLEIPPGSMQDSSISAAGDQGAVSTGVSYQVVTRGGRVELELAIDGAWLRDPHRVFPVEVDPTIQDSCPTDVGYDCGQDVAAATTFVQTGDPGPHDNDQLLDVGLNPISGQLATTYLSFSNITSSIPANSYISAAYLYLNNVQSGSCNPTQVNISQVTSSWSASTLANPPGPGYLAAPLSTGTYAAGSTPYAGVNCTGGSYLEQFPFDSAGVKLVNSWMHGAADYGLAVWASPVSSDAWKEFASDSEEEAPFLDVAYSPYADTASLTTGALTTDPTGSTAGSASVTLVNDGSATWGSSYSLVSTQEDAGVVLSTTKVTLPTVAPGGSAAVTVSIPAQLPGPTYTLVFDVSGPGSPPLFSQWGSPEGYAYYADTNIIPQLDSEEPPDNETVGTLTPVLFAQGHDPDHYPNSTVQYMFEICGGTPDAQGTCWYSPLQAAQSWAVPSGDLSWNQSYFWWAEVYDGQAYSAAPDVSFLTPEVDQQSVTSHLGANSGSIGVDAETGNYTTTATDASVPGAGPALTIQRTYNSLDPSVTEAFGAGWSSVLDMQADWVETAGSSDVVLHMADGQQEEFAQNADDTFTGPPGTTSTLIETNSNTDLRYVGSDGTVYNLDQQNLDQVTGDTYILFLTSIVEPNGEQEDFTYNSAGQVSQIENMTSRRSLWITWGSQNSEPVHVIEVATDPATAGVAGTAEVWTYGYNQNQLMWVCDPTQQAAGCTAETKYGYTTANSQYPNEIMDANPTDYWRLADSSTSPIAYDQVLANEGNDNGTYSGGVVPGSGTVPGLGALQSTLSDYDPPPAAFTGSQSGSVALPATVVPPSGPGAIELWFETTGTNEVLFSYSQNTLTAGGTSGTGSYTPALYIGSNGYLYAEFWNGSVDPIASTQAVNDGTWHQVVLTTDDTGANQTLYLDDVDQGSMSGGVTTSGDVSAPTAAYIGGGYLGGAWPQESHQGSGSGAATYFTGEIGEVSMYNHPLYGSTIIEHRDAELAPADLLDSVTLPSGAQYASIQYNPLSQRVTSVTDANGDKWTVSAPTASGSPQLYRGAVLGTQPYGYWPLDDQAGLNADNVLNTGAGTYSSVTLGAAGPFGDAAAEFSGSAGSEVKLPNGPNGLGLVQDQPPSTTIPYQLAGESLSVGLWFQTTAVNQVLFSTSTDTLVSDSTSADYSPILYVGESGLLHGGFSDCGAGDAVSTSAVNDGKWHFALVTDNGDVGTQSLYVDGVLQTTGKFSASCTSGVSEDNAYIGAGYLGDGVDGKAYPDVSNTSGKSVFPTYFTGNIAQVAFYNSALSSTQDDSLFKARGSSTGVLPTVAVNVTDAAGAAATYRYDPLNGGRLVSYTDAAGGTTTDGYDMNGFLDTVVDPDGDETITEHDAEGNALSKTTCQSLALEQCSTQYYTYYYSDASPGDVAMGGAVTSNGSVSGDGWAPSNLTNGDTTASSADEGYSSSISSNPDPASSPWVEVQLAAQHKIDRVDLFPGSNCTTSACFPGTLTIQISPDGNTWTTVASVQNYKQTAVPFAQVFSFAPTEALSIKVTGSQLSAVSSGGYAMEFGQLEASDDLPDLDNNLMLSSSDGRSASSTDTTYQTTYSYDTNGNVLKTTTPAVAGYPNGMTTQNAYTTSTTPASGGGDTPPGLLEFVYDPDYATDNYDTEYSYYSDGDMQSERDPSGLLTTYTYDNLGHVLTKTLYDAVMPYSGAGYTQQSTTTYTYDLMGRVHSETDPAVEDGLEFQGGEGHIPQTTYTYDADGNLTKQQTVDIGDGDVSRTLTWQFDPATDRLVKSTDGAGGITQYLYTATIYPASGSSYSYTDPYGAPVEQIDGDGNTTQYTYDADGRLATKSLINYTGSPYSAASPGTLVQESLAYDPDGRTVSETDAMGDTTSYTYYDNGLLNTTTISGPAANPGESVVEARTYDAAGNLLTDTQDGGLKTKSYTTDQAGRVTGTVTFGSETSLTLDGEGDILTKTVGDAGSDPTQTTDYSYSSPGRLHLQTVIDGSSQFVTTYNLDQRGDLETSVDPNGNISSYSYDQAGYMDMACKPAITTGLGTQSAQTGVMPCQWIDHDTYGDVTAEDLPNNINAVTVTAYDGDGRQIYQALPTYTAPGTTSSIAADTSTTYDGDGNVKTTTDALGNVTQYTYNQLGLKASQTNPAAPVNGGAAATQAATYTYDPLGQMTAQTDPTGAVDEATYNYLGYMQSATSVVRDPLEPTDAALDTNDVTEFSTDAAGDETSVSTPDEVATGQNPLPALETAVYNPLGEPTSTTDATGDTTTYTYGLAGALKTVVDPGAGTTQHITYDAAGRETEIWQAATPTSPNQTWTTYGYDNDGNVTSSTDPDGYTTGYTYDGDNDLVKQVQPVSATSSITTQYGYNAENQEVGSIDGNQNSTQYTYNVWGLPESETDPQVTGTSGSYATTRTIAYNADGEPTGYTESGGVQVALQYDPLGNLTQQSGSGGEAATGTVTFGYDLDGRQTSATTAAGTDQFSYDDLGLLVGTSGPSGTATFGYNGDGLMDARSDVAGSATYSYDADDRLSVESDPLTGVNDMFGYTPSSQLSDIYYQATSTSGVISASATQAFTYGDARGDLTASSLKLAGSSTPITQNYTYDADGNMLTQNTAGLAGPSSNTYTYDEADRLSSWNNGSSTVDYGYDADGNRTSIGAQTLTYNQDDELTATSGGGASSSYSYDEEGNLVSQTTGSTTQTTSYNAYGQMVGENGATVATYDGLGRVLTNGFSTLTYSGLGSQPVSNGVNEYSSLPDGSPIAVAPSGSAPGSGDYLLQDAHGDVVGDFSQSGSAAAGSVGYSPLGAVDGTSGGPTGPLGYQGGFTSANGLVDMDSRWYSPATGQFDSADSQVHSGQGASVGANQYAYAGDNPLTGTDPTGHDESSCSDNPDSVSSSCSSYSASQECEYLPGMCSTADMAQWWQEYALSGEDAAVEQDIQTDQQIADGLPGGWGQLAEISGNGLNSAGSAPLQTMVDFFLSGFELSHAENLPWDIIEDEMETFDPGNALVNRGLHDAGNTLSLGMNIKSLLSGSGLPALLEADPELAAFLGTASAVVGIADQLFPGLFDTSGGFSLAPPFRAPQGSGGGAAAGAPVVLPPPPPPCPICMAEQYVARPTTPAPGDGSGTTSVVWDYLGVLQPAPGTNPAGISLPGENAYVPHNAEPQTSFDLGGSDGGGIGAVGVTVCAPTAAPRSSPVAGASARSSQSTVPICGTDPLSGLPAVGAVSSPTSGIPQGSQAIHSIVSGPEPPALPSTGRLDPLGGATSGGLAVSFGGYGTQLFDRADQLGWNNVVLAYP